MKLSAKVAFVTGSSKGIGEDIARVFSKEGASIVVVCRTEVVAKRIATELDFSIGKPECF